jgi:hypothetical protein
MPEKMFLVEGDRKPDITFAVTTSDGSIVDLSDVTTTATFRYSQLALSSQELTKSGVIALTKTTDGSDGRLTLEWGEDSLDTPGDYEAEIEIDFDGVKNTTPHLIPYTVRRRLNSEGGPGQPGDNQYQIGIGYLTSDGETYEWKDETYAQPSENNTWTKAQRGAFVALTSTAASIAVNLALSNNFNHTLTEDTELAEPTNVVAGQSGVIHFTQHASAAKTLALSTFWQFGIDADSTITTTLSGTAVMSYFVDPGALSATCTWMNKS